MGARKREALEQFNRDNIVTAARELFETKGIDKTTMDDIARQADYSKSTIYVYFRCKEDIFNAIVQDHINILIGELELRLVEEDFESCYYGLCECLVSFAEKYPKYYSSLLGEVQMTNSRKKNGATDGTLMFAKLDELIMGFLERGQKKNIIRKDIDLRPTVLYIWSAIGGIIQMAERKSDAIDKNLNMDKYEYLRYSFKTFYDSIADRR
ncbi:MAG: TetR/AcrR family transcriptional regulator [Wujia sp.]